MSDSFGNWVLDVDFVKIFGGDIVEFCYKFI